MAISTTEKKSSFELAQKVFVNEGTKYLKNWTLKELKKYRTEPVVIPTGSYGFLVGHFSVTGINKTCWEVAQIDNKLVHNFFDKKTAILYCLYETTKRYDKANELILLDGKIGRLNNSIKHYQRILDRSKDKHRKLAVLNRYVDAKFLLREYSDILKKTLNSAKYLNFGTQLI